MTEPVDGPPQDPALMHATADAASPSECHFRRDWPDLLSATFDDQPPPRMDRAVLDEMLGYLPRDEIASNLQLLRGRMDEILRLMDEPDGHAFLGETAHTLGAIAGMFGFQALSVVSRQLGRAIEHNAQEPEPLVQQVRSETYAARTILIALAREDRGHPR